MKHSVQQFVLAAILLFSSLAWGSQASQKESPDLRNINVLQVSRKALSPSEIAQLPAEIRSQLQNAAWDLAQIWGDTILEGDYYAADETSLDQVEELYQANHLIGYRITYSSLAWDLTTCQFDSNDLSTLDACEQGQIVESGFVSGDFRQAIQDRESIVRFEGSR